METAVGDTGPVACCPIRLHFCSNFLPCWMEHSRTLEHCVGMCLQAEGNQFHHLVQVNYRTSTKVFTRQLSCSSVNYCIGGPPPSESSSSTSTVTARTCLRSACCHMTVRRLGVAAQANLESSSSGTFYSSFF
jgi:hypothetical protein